jgi:hypothetical protein
MDYGTSKSSLVAGKKNKPQKWWVFFPVTRLLELRGTQSVTQRMRFHPPITNDYLDVWDEWYCCCPHNPLHLCGQPSMERIRCVTQDLSTNGVTPCRQFPWRNQLCVIISSSGPMRKWHVGKRSPETGFERRGVCVWSMAVQPGPFLRHVTGGGWAAQPDTDIFVCVAQECNLLLSCGT